MAELSGAVAQAVGEGAWEVRDRQDAVAYLVGLVNGLLIALAVYLFTR